MEKKRSVNRGEESPTTEKPTDEIDFGRPVKITLVRIPKPKRELYGRLTSITQSQPIKGFEIYFRNLEQTSGRFSLLVCSNDFMITSTQDVLITPQKPFVTDLIVIRGAYLKLSLCIYGNYVEGANLWGKEATINEGGMAMEIKRNIFEQKRKCIHAIENELGVNFSGREDINLRADYLEEAANDDDINEPQIKNICNISQHLLNTFQQINEDQYIVKFRQNIENINNHLQKLFKSKQLGLYYPKQQNYAIQNQIPLPLIHIALSSLKLVLSDQYRVLQMLKMLVQLPRHANALIESGGVTQLSLLFIEFYKPGAVYFSTFKNLVLQVCIGLSQWPSAAQRMVTKLQQHLVDEIYEGLIVKSGIQLKKIKDRQTIKQRQKRQQKEKLKQKGKSRSRSREKGKQKKSKSDSQDSQNDNDSKRKKEKKDKKDKKDKRKKDKDKSKQKDKKKDRDKYQNDKKDKQRKKDKDKEKDREREKDKDKEREKEKDKDKQTRMKDEKQKKDEINSPIKPESSQSQTQLNKLSFYQILFFMLLQQKNSKTLNLIKILIEQITQTLTKNKQISQQIAHVTTFLRDTKYLFNQGTQIINSKSLKVFATFQPFLNDNQSQNVDCKYISQKEKLKNPAKYGINPKTFKILNKINLQITSNIHKEALGIGTPFDESFMVMMSELIFQKQKPILSGFSQIVNSFKADGLMHLQRHEASISIIADYIYKALLDDEGINTFIYIEQIYASLLKFIGLLSEDPSIFSTELKSRIKLLSNYATPYDHFSRAEGAFKVFCEYFLRLFKYDNYEIEINNKAKLTDFKKKEYDKLMNPFTFENLSQNYAMKNFNDVSSNQPIVQIDVCLKIFLILCEYNKNIWTTFYQNKLISGFSSLLNKVSNLLLFYLDHSANRWTSYTNAKSYLVHIDNYLTVVKHILMLMGKKCRYEAAYNDLLQQDLFEDVQLYQKSIDIYIHLYNALHDQSLMVYTQKSKNKMKYILNLAIQIIDQFLTAYQLISHQTRQLKLRRLIDFIYITHYSSLKSRPAIISIFSQILKHGQGASSKYFISNLLDSHFTLNKLLQNQVAYIPQNDRCILQNIIKTNLFRVDPLITNNLAILIRNLFSKSQYVDKSLDIIQRIFDQIDQQFKKNQQQNGQIGWKDLRKAHLFTEVLIRSQATIKSRLDDKLMRFFKRILDSYRKKGQLKEIAQNQQDCFIIFLKVKNNFIQYFSRLLKECSEIPNILLQLFESTIKSLSFEHLSFAPYDSLSDFQKKVNIEVLRTCLIYTKGLAIAGLSTSYQCILLYGQMMQKPYKPQTFLSFTDSLCLLQKIVNQKYYNEDSAQFNEIKGIISAIFQFLCNLTTINGDDLFTTESRRGALIYLISPNEKQFPFNGLKQSIISKYIPKQSIKKLQQYFSYPIVERAINIKNKVQLKPQGKTKFAVYSKCVFNIISQHDPVSKARYKYIGGDWIGGDIQKGLYTPFRYRNYQQQIQKYIINNHINTYQQYHYKQYNFNKEDIFFNQLFYLSIKKDRQEIQKKEIDRTIHLKDIIPKLTPQEIKKDIPKPSPSPSKITNPIHTNLVSPQSNNPSMPLTSPLNNKSGINNIQKGYNRSSNPRSSSQNSGQQSYVGNNNHYNQKQAQPSQMNSFNTHYNPTISNPMQMHGNYPQQSSYPGYYGHPPPNMYNPPPHQRYPAAGYHPMGHPMYPAMPSAHNPSIYNPQMSDMYPQMAPNQLNQYEQQMFQEAYNLVNEIRGASNMSLNLSDQEVNTKKSRLNYILSSYPKVHTKLKVSLLPSQS